MPLILFVQMVIDGINLPLGLVKNVVRKPLKDVVWIAKKESTKLLLLVLIQLHIFNILENIKKSKLEI